MLCRTVRIRLHAHWIPISVRAVRRLEIIMIELAVWPECSSRTLRFDDLERWGIPVWSERGVWGGAGGGRWAGGVVGGRAGDWSAMG